MTRGQRLQPLTRHFSATDRFTWVFPRIHSLEVAASELQKLKTIAGRNLVGGDERLDQAQAALVALNALARDAASLASYDLVSIEPAVIVHWTPHRSPPGRLLSSRFATPRAQTALVDFASQNSRPLEARQAAAEAFTAAVKLRGLGLTRVQIIEQYSRYNASALLDKSQLRPSFFLIQAFHHWFPYGKN